MKGQDILLLFKMASLYAQEEALSGWVESDARSDAVEGFRYTTQSHLAIVEDVVREPSVAYAADVDRPVMHQFLSGSRSFDVETGIGAAEPVMSLSLTSRSEQYSLRALSASLGLSKSEISNAMARCRDAGMLTNDYDTGLPRVNRRELLAITEHALKYFFPVKPGAMVRGIPTGFAAPVLSKNIKSAGGLILVWPDPQSAERGQAIEPLYKTVPEAVKQDRTLYHYLALVDAVRLGGPRESGVAIKILKAGMGLP